MDVRKERVDYEQFIPRESGFIFKFIKKDGQFIHTFTEGKLLEKLGLNPGCVVGKSLCDFLPADQAASKKDFYEKAWDGETVNYEGNVDGVHYLATLIPMRKNSEVVEVIGTAVDITKEKETMLQVRQMEKLSVVGELAAGIAHEIRNPLTSLKGFTKIVRENIEDRKLTQYLDIMLEEMDRINEIVNEFMFIAKPNEHVHFEHTNIKKLLEECIHFMEPQAHLKSIEIEFVVSSEIFLNCDRKQMKQVLINLLQNAIEATDDGGQSIEVSLEEEELNAAKISVMDKGCGISEERFKRLFEPFYSTKEKGTGLGLITCKRIIDLHQGSINIESRPVQGTTVSVILPK